MNTIIEHRPTSLTKEAKFIEDVKEASYKDFISNSIYLRNEYKKSLKEHFEILKNLWLEETKMSSNVYMTLKHPAHLSILNLGIEIIPFLLEDLQEHNNHWFYTLSIITGENPIMPESLGDIEKISDDWIEWGKSKNFID